MRTAEHARIIRELSGDETCSVTVADHDTAERAELELPGIRTKPAGKSVIRGIQQVKNRLAEAGGGRPRLFFFSTLKNTLEEICNYIWAQESGKVNAREEAVKLNDHAMDAMCLVTALDSGTRGEWKVKSLSAEKDPDSDLRWRE